MKSEIANSILIDLRFVIRPRSAWKWCRYLQAKRSFREIESLSKCNFWTFVNEHGVTLSLVDLAIVNLVKRNTLYLLNREISTGSLSNENTFFFI